MSIFYTILSGSASELSASVEEHREAGYYAIGSANTIDGTTFYQAMEKSEDDSKYTPNVDNLYSRSFRRLSITGSYALDS